MRKENIIRLSAVSLVALAAVVSISYYAFAASTTTAGNSVGATSTAQFGYGRHWRYGNLNAKQKAALDAKKAAAEARYDAVQKALAANNYDAWVAAVKQINADAPILEKINAGNFSKLFEANADLEKALSIMKELDINGSGFGFGPGKDRAGRRGDFSRMMSGGMMNGWGRLTDSDDNQAATVR